MRRNESLSEATHDFASCCDLFGFISRRFFGNSPHTVCVLHTPSQQVLLVDGMSITVGPPPNSTNVPLDSKITVDALASVDLKDLHMTPEVAIARVTSEVTGPLTYLNAFYPAKLLKPATCYNVSVAIMGVPLSWSFTTTNKSFNPGISFYLANNVLWIALSIAALATTIVGFAVWFNGKRV